MTEIGDQRWIVDEFHQSNRQIFLIVVGLT